MQAEEAAEARAAEAARAVALALREVQMAQLEELKGRILSDRCNSYPMLLVSHQLVTCRLSGGADDAAGAAQGPHPRRQVSIVVKLLCELCQHRFSELHVPPERAALLGFRV